MVNQATRYGFLQLPLNQYKTFPQKWTAAREVTNPEARAFVSALEARGLWHEFSGGKPGTYYVSHNQDSVGITWTEVSR